MVMETAVHMSLYKFNGTFKIAIKCQLITVQGNEEIQTFM